MMETIKSNEAKIADNINDTNSNHSESVSAIRSRIDNRSLTRAASRDISSPPITAASGPTSTSSLQAKFDEIRVGLSESRSSMSLHETPKAEQPLRRPRAGSSAGITSVGITSSGHSPVLRADPKPHVPPALSRSTDSKGPGSRPGESLRSSLGANLPTAEPPPVSAETRSRSSTFSHAGDFEGIEHSSPSPSSAKDEFSAKMEAYLRRREESRNTTKPDTHTLPTGKPAHATELHSTTPPGPANEIKLRSEVSSRTSPVIQTRSTMHDTNPPIGRALANSEHESRKPSESPSSEPHSSAFRIPSAAERSASIRMAKVEGPTDQLERGKGIHEAKPMDPSQSQDQQAANTTQRVDYAAQLRKSVDKRVPKTESESRGTSPNSILSKSPNHPELDQAEPTRPIEHFSVPKHPLSHAPPTFAPTDPHRNLEPTPISQLMLKKSDDSGRPRVDLSMVSRSSEFSSSSPNLRESLLQALEETRSRTTEDDFGSSKSLYLLKLRKEKASII